MYIERLILFIEGNYQDSFSRDLIKLSWFLFSTVINILLLLKAFQFNPQATAPLKLFITYKYHNCLYLINIIYMYCKER